MLSTANIKMIHKNAILTRYDLFSRSVFIFCPFSFCPTQAYQAMCPFAFSVHFLFSDKLCFHASCHPDRSYPIPPSCSTPPPPPIRPGAARSPFRRSRGTGKSSLSSSLGGCLLACGPSCASAWRRGWGSIPGRWCTGMARLRCGCAGV